VVLEHLVEFNYTEFVFLSPTFMTNGGVEKPELFQLPCETMFGLVVAVNGNVMPATQLLVGPAFHPATKPLFFLPKKKELESTKGPIQGDFILRNTHRNAHMCRSRDLP
jgi:hypothetical protein